MTQRYILTGAPGAGKTVLIRQLERDGFAVVEEAATDVIALEQARGVTEPWQDVTFTLTIADLQIQRQQRASAALQFHDRSLICTYALAQFLGHDVPASLAAAIARAVEDKLFEPRVFFVELLGYITPTAARRIGLAEARHFAQVHEDAYRRFGFELIRIAPADIETRTAAIRRAISP